MVNTQLKILRVFGPTGAEVSSVLRGIRDDGCPGLRLLERDGEFAICVQVSAPNRAMAEQYCDKWAARLRAKFGDDVFAEGETSLAQATLDALLEKRKLLVAVDEPTGRLLGSLLQPLPHSEAVFDFGTESYADPQKSRRITVPEQLLRHGDAAGFLRVSVALGAKVKNGLAVGQRLQKAAQQAARRLVHGNQQLAFFQQRVQRGLGQACLPLGKDIVAELGAQPRGPFIAVLLRHGAVGGADLHTDGKLAVPFQQTQAGAAIIPDAPQHGGYLRARGPENTQDFQLSVDHGGTFLCLEMLPSLSVGADSISARGSFLQPQTGRAHIECAPTVLRFKYLNLCPPSPA